MWSWNRTGRPFFARSDSTAVDFEEKEVEDETPLDAPALPVLPSPSKTTGACPPSVDDYLQQCQKYKTEPNSGILVSLRFQLPVLRPTKPFHCKDVLPLAEVLIAGGAPHVVEGDFTLARLRSHGAITLAHALPKTNWQVLKLRHNPIGGYGAAALAPAVAKTASLSHVDLRACSIGAVGAEAFASAVVEKGAASARTLDLSVNATGLRGTLRMKAALAVGDGSVKVDMDNNIVLAEVLNSLTHGLGVLATLAAWGPLVDRAAAGQWAHVWSSKVYLVSLLTLYSASTLYHSFYFARETKSLLHLFDRCAIYVLIAGTYTPVLTIALHSQPLHSTYLLGLLWAASFGGITMTISYAGREKGKIAVVLYLVMGWAALACLRDLLQVLPYNAVWWLFMGGVMYTAGVPFFMLDSDPTTSMYHVVWHVFVMVASGCHFWSIYEYVVPLAVPAVA
mmetsp:Transcript_45477/g.114030  ORF Transcript_45477/g.114030 Transcript_45477/m.114030 type:complete len:451 (-) Transcript_45477:144-1496(-)